jgi:AcrR family transcriptional regulator
MPPADGAEAATDRRVLRGQRNREAVVQAFLDLVAEGDLAPTAQKVAARAGLSLRSVFHHFEDMEQLFASAADLHVTRYIGLVEPLPDHGPLADRIAAFVDQRARVAEKISPVYRAASLVTHRSPTIHDRLARGNALLRRQAANTFGPELASAGELDWRLDAIDALASIDGWLRLRDAQGLSERRARAVLRAAIAAVLSDQP